MITVTKKQNQLFDDVCKFRVASYPLQDRHCFNDDWIISIEEDILSNHGYEYEDYQEWKDEDQNLIKVIG